MLYDNKLVAAKLRRWENFMREFRLPAWEELPDLELYMDQVVALVCRYVDLHDSAPEPVLTPSSVNNYVRLKVMPAPVRKRYGRLHLAHLVVICCLKRSMSLASIQRVFPVDLTLDEARQIYGDFVRQYQAASLLFVEQVRQAAGPVLDPKGAQEYPVNNLVVTAAVAGALYQLLADKILSLQSPADENAGKGS